MTTAAPPIDLRQWNLDHYREMRAGLLRLGWVEHSEIIQRIDAQIRRLQGL